MLFVGGRNTRITNPRWWTATILKIEKSPYLSNCLTDYHAGGAMLLQGFGVVTYSDLLNPVGC